MTHSIARRVAGALVLFAAADAALAAPSTRVDSTAAPTPAARLAEVLAPPVVGLVRDSAGAPLANVQVVIAGLNRVVVTDERGGFVFRGLPPGRYHLDAILLGYARADADVVVPVSGPDVRVTIVMRQTALQLQNVVVSASPVGADPLRLTQSTVALSGKELSRNLGASVAQTLSNEPGMAMRYNGPAANTPVIRGLSGERVLVLQDGSRAGDLSAASADHGLSIDPLSATRIEVVRGPASLQYGTNALGGVVNVVTNDIPTELPTHTDGWLATQAESVNPGGAVDASVTARLGGPFAFRARGGVRRGDDLRQGGGARLANSYNRNQNALAGIGYVGEALHAGLSFGTYAFEYGLPAPPDDEAPTIRGARHELRGRTDYPLGAVGPFRYIRAEGSAQWYDHDEIEPTGEVGTRFDLRTQTASLTGRTAFGRAEGAVGVNGLFRQYRALGAEAVTPGAHTNSGGVFVYLELPLSRSHEETEHGTDEHSSGARLQLGARYDAFRIETRLGEAKFGAPRARTFGNVSGSVGLSVPLAERVTLGLSAARAFRAPTVEELFSNGFHAAVGTYDVGDAALDVETNQGVDAVVRAQRGRTDAQVSAYWNRINDFITPSIVGTVTEAGDPVDPSSPDAVPLNRFRQADARLYGVEGRVEREVRRGLVLGVTGDYVRGEFVRGGALPFMPPARLGGIARWDDGRISASAEVRRGFAQDRTSQTACGLAGGAAADADDDGVPCVDLATGAYTVANVSIGFNLVRRTLAHSITLRADNLLDEAYHDASSRIKSFARTPGRNLSLVYRVVF